jgi:hypothetical protein
MEFYCVYVKARKKFDKYTKVNRIRNKCVIDVKKIIDEEEVDYDKDKIYLKILINQKILAAIEKNRDIYYIPDFDQYFDIEKLLNIKKLSDIIINFNVLIFFNDFRKENDILGDVMGNLSKFSNSQIIRDY